MALLAAGTAEAWTLDALLRLPLERLLELRVAMQRTAHESPKLFPSSGTGTGTGGGPGHVA